MIRSGLEVAWSIARVASSSNRRFVGRPPWNDWWGGNELHWRRLKNDGKAAGYYADEVDELQGDAERGAYEWLVGMREVERWRQVLGDRVLDVNYRDLVQAPEETINAIGHFLNLPDANPWAIRAAKLIRLGSELRLT